MTKLLEIKELAVNFQTYAGTVQAVRGVSLDVAEGEVVALVGESGCGKSVTAQSIMRLIPCPPGVMAGGSIRFNGQEITTLSNRAMEEIRGKEMGMIFQDPMTSLNPTMTVGAQIVEVLQRHGGMNRAAMVEHAQEMLHTVGLPNPRRRFRQYPHEFSGGMRQRAIIAMALACNPRLLIADEPTTALDVTIQAQIIELMRRLQQQFRTTVILITHDLGIVAGFAHRVIVMYAGKVVEAGPTNAVFRHPQHPYTKGLLAAVPRLDLADRQRLTPIVGRPPDLLSPPSGCAFWPRCPQAMRICAVSEPGSWLVGEEHHVSCWLLDERAAKVAGKVG